MKRYRGGSVAKSCTDDGIIAAIDDGLLNINFQVLGFETTFFDNMGNAVLKFHPVPVFVPAERDVPSLVTWKTLYISRVRAKGPDGVERSLPTTLEVIVN